MPDLTGAEVRVFPDPDALAEAIATEVCTLIQAAIGRRGECARSTRPRPSTKCPPPACTPIMAA